ncbi:MAG: FecR domain-containing protein, partial [Pseudolabrys sp.]
MIDPSGTPHGKSEAGHSISSDGADAAFLIVPNAQLLFSADFKRSGSDLTLDGPKGQHLRINDYFQHEKLPDLVAPDGATLPADVVEKLAGPLAPNQYAQATSPPAAAGQFIGKVDKLTGSVTAIRNGVAITLNAGDAIDQGDVIQTGSNSTVGIILVDGTALNLSANTRMVMNDFAYEANSTTNSGLLSLVHGGLVFVAGAIA